MHSTSTWWVLNTFSAVLFRNGGEFTLTKKHTHTHIHAYSHCDIAVLSKWISCGCKAVSIKKSDYRSYMLTLPTLIDIPTKQFDSTVVRHLQQDYVNAVRSQIAHVYTLRETVLYLYVTTKVSGTQIYLLIFVGHIKRRSLRTKFWHWEVIIIDRSLFQSEMRRDVMNMQGART